MTLTREDLHRRVWVSPMKEVAAELRISSVELKKICRDLGVPYPHPKFWARKRAGEKVVELQLPKKSEVTPSCITIKPAHGSGSERPVDFSNDIDRSFKSTSTPSERHPVIAAWLAKRQARMGLSPDGSSLSRWGAAELRGHYFLEEIFRRLEAKGLAIRSGTRTFSFICVYETEEIHCRLRERKKRVRDAVGFGSREHWTELKPTGLFTFTIDSFLGIQSPIRREWRETLRKRLDEVMPEIASALLQAGPGPRRVTSTSRRTREGAVGDGAAPKERGGSPACRPKSMAGVPIARRSLRTGFSTAIFFEGARK